ncbi:hypothetical protein Phi18:3_gp048 [Cellulophaga phage phi18:3]|uniref:Uncharacterized protein n=1 Tax=Cellulophaga phage phi18:3 TaxID=1327983 RepID=S0A1A4_9CAUD|nr:hypothetical protein Phi18:3_gp048 [Cellulophaga phage phi18:3]AGO48560.1 hypothetical protein Phi18:3_gp048 [Cellulophaga phage phi18:3]
MKIEVNKTAVERRMQEVIKDILDTAKETANKGLTNFVYEFNEAERRSFPKSINMCIERESKGTVKCGYRSDYFTSVRYYITTI